MSLNGESSYVYQDVCSCSIDLRLLEYAPLYYDMSSYPDGETKKVFQRIQMKQRGKSAGGADGQPKKKKRKKADKA